MVRLFLSLIILLVDFDKITCEYKEYNDFPVFYFFIQQLIIEVQIGSHRSPFGSVHLVYRTKSHRINRK